MRDTQTDQNTDRHTDRQTETYEYLCGSETEGGVRQTDGQTDGRTERYEYPCGSEVGRAWERAGWMLLLIKGWINFLVLCACVRVRESCVSMCVCACVRACVRACVSERAVRLCA